MKVFNLKEVKNGAKVVTRNGRNARIVCFDAKGKYPLIALIENDENEEEIISVTKDGRFYNNNDKQSDLDLFMYEEPRFNLEDAIKNGCKTRSGNRAEILKDFRTGSEEYAIGVIIHHKDFDSVELYTINGKYEINHTHPEDLINL